MNYLETEQKHRKGIRIQFMVSLLAVVVAFLFYENKQMHSLIFYFFCGYGLYALVRLLAGPLPMKWLTIVRLFFIIGGGLVLIGVTYGMLSSIEVNEY